VDLPEGAEMNGDKIVIDRSKLLVLLSRIEAMLEEVRDLKTALKKG